MESVFLIWYKISIRLFTGHICRNLSQIKPPGIIRFLDNFAFTSALLLIIV